MRRIKSFKVFEESTYYQTGIDTADLYDYIEKPTTELEKKFKDKELFLDDLLNTKDGQSLLTNPQLAPVIKKTGIKINFQKTRIEHPQDLARIVKSLVLPKVIDFNELIKTPKIIDKHTAQSDSWSDKTIDAVSRRENIDLERWAIILRELGKDAARVR